MLTTWPSPGQAVSDAEALHLHGSRYIGLRTRFYDDQLLAAAQQKVLQVVLLGAGLDARAFRLSLPPKLTIFEIDQPEVLDWKDGVLRGRGTEPRCQRMSIGLDLRDDWPSALKAFGFDESSPVAWIAEGLLPYLSPEDQSKLLERMSECSAPTSTLAFDRIAGDVTAGGRAERLAKRSGIQMDHLLSSGEADDPRAFLEASGWQTDERSADQIAAQYKRDLRDPFSTSQAEAAVEPPWFTTTFLTARLRPDAS